MRERENKREREQERERERRGKGREKENHHYYGQCLNGSLFFGVKSNQTEYKKGERAINSLIITLVNERERNGRRANTSKGTI